MGTTTRGIRTWAVIALIGGAIVTGAALSPWLALSVDILARDEVTVTATELGWDDVSGGVILPICGVIAALAAIGILVRPSPRQTGALILVLSMVVAVGGLTYVYLARVDVFTNAAVDATASEEIPVEAVERVVDLALRSGAVEVEPQGGYIAAATGAVVALIGGIVLLRMRISPASPVPAGAHGHESTLDGDDSAPRIDEGERPSLESPAGAYRPDASDEAPKDEGSRGLGDSRTG